MTNEEGLLEMVSESPAGRALRALQKYDQLAAWNGVEHRQLLIDAMGELGGLLGIVCTGDDEGQGYFNHDGDTCPVHEWLVPADAPDDADVLRSRSTDSIRFLLDGLGVADLAELNLRVGLTAGLSAALLEDMPRMGLRVRVAPGGKAKAG